MICRLIKKLHFAKLLMLPFIVSCMLMILLCGCSENPSDKAEQTQQVEPTRQAAYDEAEQQSAEKAAFIQEGAAASEQNGSEDDDSLKGAASQKPDPEEYYYDLENVVLYLDAYGELPLNYITKKEAKARGWEGGSVEDYVPDAAIGGDYYGNYEKRLPSDSGIVYHECDIDTHGYKNRGSRRLIFSDDGRYYYTKDHYETFTEVFVEDGKVSGY